MARSFIKYLNIARKKATSSNAICLLKMTGLVDGPHRRWVDLVDEENEPEEEEVFVTIRLPSGKSTHVVMEARDTVSDLNKWLEKTEGLSLQSFVLSHNGQYLTRRLPMASLGASCELHMTMRTQSNGLPRGMLVLRNNCYVKRNR